VQELQVLVKDIAELPQRIVYINDCYLLHTGMRAGNPMREGRPMKKTYQRNSDKSNIIGLPLSNFLRNIPYPQMPQRTQRKLLG
jgi:hypothetical protein